ncbi:hypothetical protein HDU82_007155 [Entophlyctis luteolus]|nr:hypothetical protein HDU82_007155 [Entophlyctis luteolus]
MLFHVRAATQTLEVELSLMNQLAAAKFFDVSIPLDQIDGVVASPPQAWSNYKGFKTGINLPGIITAGTFYHGSDPGKCFFFITQSERTIGFCMKPGAPYALVVLGVPDHETAEECKARIDREIIIARNLLTPINVTYPALHGDLTLSGTLSMPVHPASHALPLVVFVHGSGPLDRDENSGFIQFNIFNNLAVIVAESGAASLRYDKRGVAKSQSPSDKNLFYRSGIDDLSNDVVASVNFALSTYASLDSNNINTALIAAGHPPKGLIALCGFGESLRSALSFQRQWAVSQASATPGLKGWFLRYLINEDTLSDDALQKLIDSIKDEDMGSALFGLIKTPTKWFGEHFTWDSAADYAGITCDVLAIGGDKDFQTRSSQCTAAVASSLMPRARSHSTHRIANMTHALREIDGQVDLLSIKEEYIREGKMPLSMELQSIVLQWLEEMKRK